ncbi:MAG: GGDEF domain-containing protein [Caldimonas sp.]
MSATDVAFSMVGLMQAVLALVWLLGSWLLADTRRAAIHWSAFAALSAISFVLMIAALHARPSSSAELLRAAGNMAWLAAAVALHRGVWLFVGRPMGVTLHLLVLGAGLVASYLGLSPTGGSVRIGTLSALLTLLVLLVARDLHVYARDGLGMRWPWLMSLPGAFGAVGFAYRGVRAVAWPATVAAEMTTNSALNVGSAFSYMVIVLTFHATLIALVLGRLLADLRHRARHDGLTGLLNRRAIEESIEAQIRRSLRTGEAFSVLMLDLDHFKSINDRFGHAAGDQALSHVAALMKAGVREVDSIARIGGEEFVALMPGAALAAVTPVAERLREQLEAHPLLLDASNVAVTVSIGIAQWADKTENMSRLLVRADRALYQAKQEGRNRVVTAGTEIRTIDIAAPAMQ